jgi:hypothetical protein
LEVVAQANHREETKMKLLPDVTVVSALGVAVALTAAASSVWADSAKKGELHLTKDCTAFINASGPPGGFCTITQSNVLKLIPNGSAIYYDQGFGEVMVPVDKPAALVIDSNVLLFVGPGDWARGRCTFDTSANPPFGLCTFDDGAGDFVGFSARVNVSPSTATVFSVNGTYSFTTEPR